jgi:hypothetical protein
LYFYLLFLNFFSPAHEISSGVMDAWMKYFYDYLRGINLLHL